jgi:hypothetical protein
MTLIWARQKFYFADVLRNLTLSFWTKSAQLGKFYLSNSDDLGFDIDGHYSANQLRGWRCAKLITEILR